MDLKRNQVLSQSTLIFCFGPRSPVDLSLPIAWDNPCAETIASKALCCKWMTIEPMTAQLVITGETVHRLFFEINRCCYTLGCYTKK